MYLIVKKILYPKISSIACIVTLILFFLFLGQPNIHAATCSDTAGTIVISSDCEDFVSSGSINSLTINNGVTVEKSGTSRAIKLSQTIGTITINGTVADEILLNGNTITTIDIGAGASVTDNDSKTFHMNVGTTITNFTNAGTISNSSSNAIYNNRGRITNLTNTGTITVTSGADINNNGSITTLENDQGGSDALIYDGEVPTNYNIIINSASDFGKIIFNGTETGNMTFEIKSGSTVAAGTYAGVLQSLAAARLTATTGTFGSLNWTLTENGSGTWDLVTETTQVDSPTPQTPQVDSTTPQVDPTTDKNVIGTLDAQESIVKNTFTQSVGIVSNRLNNLRQNRGNDNFSKNNIKLDFGNALLTSLAETVHIGNISSGKLIPNDWSSWSEGTISMTKIGDTSNSSSKEIDSQGIAVGFDRKLNDNDLFGFAVQYGQSDTDVGTSGTGIDSNNYNLSIYRTKPLVDNNFIEGTIGIGLIESDLVRKSGANTLTSSRDGNQIFGSINYGKTFNKKDFNLTPIGRIDLGYTELDAYTESGTDALSYDKQTVESGLASIGLEINNIIKFNQNNFKPFGKVEYGLDFSNSSDAKMHYVSDTSTTYTYTQGINSTHLLSGEIGFNFMSKENLLITTSYKRIQGSESEHSDIIKLGVNFKAKRETEYAMSVDGSDDLKAGFDVTKKVNGFDLGFNLDQKFDDNYDPEAKFSLSKKF